MKAVVVFNESASISFYTVDSEFRKHLHDRMVSLGAVSETAPAQVADPRFMIAFHFNTSTLILLSACVYVYTPLWYVNGRVLVLMQSAEEEDDLREALGLFFLPLVASFVSFTMQ